jgi:hypothetical protein
MGVTQCHRFPRKNMSFTKRSLWKYLTNDPDVEYNNLLYFNGHKLCLCGLFQDKENNTVLIEGYECITCKTFGTQNDFILLECVETNSVTKQKLHNKLFRFLCPYKPKIIK